MYSQQNGFFPLLVKLLGMAILVYFILVTLLQAISKLITNHEPIELLITVVASSVVLVFPVWLGLLLVKMFPSVRVVKNGIKYMSIGFLKGIIKWDEIEELLLFENGYIAVAFHRPGLFLLNGTYFNQLYGKLIRHESAVLFLSPGTANREEILTTIYHNSNVKSVKEIRPKNK